MAKKQTKKTEDIQIEEPQVKETVVVEAPRVEVKPQPKKKPGLEDGWVIKDRVYVLKQGRSPLSYSMRTNAIYYFDEDKGYERELKHTSNQRTCFVDEMVGDQRLEHIIFRNGTLAVPKNKVTLQKLLSLYHPMKDRLFEEVNKVVNAANDIDWLELEIKALNLAIDLDIDTAEAVMRVELGSKVSKMSSKEIKRDLLLYAKKNPSLFIELVSDDNVMLRNFGIKATELGIITLSADQRTFKWATNDRKLCTVPFDEHPYSALAAWFKTDEGMEIYSNIEKRLN
tara:strand:+ start:217 stop:1068 length:852 start_codon:yes stop_codon:yes gene_type:complete